MNYNEGNYWFKRLQRDLKRISPYIKFRRIKYGYYRIYWSGSGENAYLGECPKELPIKGYDIYENDIRLDSKKHYEEFEDTIELTKKIGNYIDGYYEIYKQLKTRIYMMKHNKEFYKTVVDGYKQMRVV